MRKYSGHGLDELASEILAREPERVDAVGDAAFIRDRIAGAVERFNTRKDDWATATAIASERSKKAPSRAAIAKVYQNVREIRLSPPEPGRLRPTLEALEKERRDAERDRVKGIRDRKKAEGKSAKKRKR